MFLADYLFIKETTSRETCGYEVEEECPFESSLYRKETTSRETCGYEVEEECPFESSLYRKETTSRETSFVENVLYIQNIDCNSD